MACNQGRYEMRFSENLKKTAWSKADKIAAFVVAVSLSVSGLWFAFPTSSLIHNVSMTVQGSLVRYVRETPYGEVTAEWQAEITLIDGDGFTCPSGPWAATTYQDITSNTVTYNLGAWADDCLTAGPPYYMTITRRALLFGIIPLRQSIQTTEVQGERDLELGYLMRTTQPSGQE
jgi:hypothetical protein